MAVLSQSAGLDPVIHPYSLSTYPAQGLDQISFINEYCRYRIEHYLEPGSQRDVYTHWLRDLRDMPTKVGIVRRLARLAHGHFGDHKFCRDGVWALRIDRGPGYRIYYAICDDRLILLLCAGTKRTQQADIEIAVRRWQRCRTRGNNEKQTT